MYDLKSYGVFAETVAAGSMSAAARRLGMTPSAVSQIIGGLERQTGVTLLHRSTRRLTLTEAGERCYPHCLRLLEAGRAASSSLEHARDAPIGELRIAAPMGFGAHIAPALASTLVEWPQLRLRLILDDVLSDLVQHRIDIALRVGWEPDGVWTTRQLCALDTILCAAPAYLERYGQPERPAELSQHRWLGHDQQASEATSIDKAPYEVSLDLNDGAGRRETVDLPVRIATTNQLALQQMCEQGVGIARLFYVDARQSLERGALVRVLPRWFLPAWPLTMATPKHVGTPAKTRIAMTAIERYFSGLQAGPR